MQSSDNPYAAPSAIVAQAAELREAEKASRGSRLGAYFIDSILYLLCWGPGYFQLAMAGEELPIEYGPLGTSISILGLVAGLALFGYNLWLLHTHGQTVAKRLLGIRIVRSDGSRASLGRLFWMRSFLPAVLSAIPCLGTIFNLVDTRMIFGEDKRCLHDKMADTIVVRA
jgi:uncharacterized RDD family membrane protein YckC